MCICAFKCHALIEKGGLPPPRHENLKNLHQHGKITKYMPRTPSLSKHNYPSDHCSLPRKHVLDPRIYIILFLFLPTLKGRLSVILITCLRTFYSIQCMSSILTICFGDLKCRTV